MKILHSTKKYLSTEIIYECFESGKQLSVDKQVCGNGFSHGFLNLDIRLNKKNILIFPNRGAIMSKHDDYKAKGYKYKNKIKFFYKGSTDIDFNNADVLCFVADSLIYRKDSISNIVLDIDKVLCDESHATEQQSYDFREVLVDFDAKVKEMFYAPETSITKVTASPRLFSNTDIFIENALIKEQIIYKSSNRIDTINRINADVRKKENIIVFTNSSSIIYNLRNYKNEVKANFKIGAGLMISICELVKVIDTPDSNLVICSSRGFEGWDDFREGVKVYFFEDRGRDEECFYISNLYQAINRARLGAIYIEYCRREVDTRKEPFKDIRKEVDGFISDTFKYKGVLLSVDNKQKSAYKKYKPFVIFNEDDNGVFTIKRSDTSIELYLETLIYDKGFNTPEFTEFINQRKLVFKNIADAPAKLIHKLKNAFKPKNLYNNRELIAKNYYFDADYTAPIFYKYSYAITDTNAYRKLYLKDLETYLRRKNYDGAYVYSEREERALNILKSKNDFRKLVKDITYTYDTRSIEKYGPTESAPYRAEFRKQSAVIVGMLIMMFTNNRIKVPSKWSAHRDYNLLTKIGMDELIFMGKVFNMEVLEVDARSCYPRILYALCGKTLPDDFYGFNKERKTEINVFINDFFYDDKVKPRNFIYDNNKASSKSDQKKNARKKFKRLGFDADVVEYLISNYFECKHRGALFSKISFYEKKLISQVKEECDRINEGIVRRHDSVILFNNESDISFLNEFEYLGVKGWFNIKSIPVISINRDDTPDDKWIEGEFDSNHIKIASNDY